MRKIYIISTYTGTVLSSIIRTISKKPYSHISLSLDDTLETMYSFGRINPENPFCAGFVEEGIDKGLYKIKKNTICRVYSLYITEDEYLALKENIDIISAERELYSYDIISLMTIPMGISRNSRYGYVCSSFVAHMLSKSGIELLDKEHFLIQPNDFYNHSKLKLEYEGLLNDYNKNYEELFVPNPA